MAGGQVSVAPVSERGPLRAGVILVNLGSPAAPEPAAVRAFLGQFLSDRRVVELPAWIWQPLLKCIILPLRSRRVARLYHEIWTPEGSPLTAMTVRQARCLQQRLADSGQTGIVVAHAMTYGEPSMGSVVRQFRQQGIEKLLLIPLYPQYSGTTTGAVYDQVAALTVAERHVPDITVVRQYCERGDYLDALAQSVRDHRQRNGSGDLLLFSFHGIPKSCVDQGDPYRDQCLQTAEGVAARLGLAPAQWQVAFQSRFGKAEWLKPYTDELLAGLPAQGIRRLDIICPAFAADCLETLEEIEEGSRACFLGAGGEYFSRIPCLNDREDHIAVFQAMVEGFLAPRQP